MPFFNKNSISKKFEMYIMPVSRISDLTLVMFYQNGKMSFVYTRGLLEESSFILYNVHITVFFCFSLLSYLSFHWPIRTLYVTKFLAYFWRWEINMVEFWNITTSNLKIFEYLNKLVVSLFILLKILGKDN